MEATEASSSTQPLQNGRNENGQAQTSQPDLKSLMNQRREMELATIIGGRLTSTRIVELNNPDPVTKRSLVAVLKPDRSPYLAQVDMGARNIEELVNAQEPPTVEVSSMNPESIKINPIPTKISMEDVSGMNRMIHIPLQQTIDRDPNASNGAGPFQTYSRFRDPEKDAPVQNLTFAPGYPSTAAIMSTDPELSIYRRFDRLNTRNFLYYQAELMYLEAEMDKLDEEDRLLEEPEAKYHLRHFKELRDAKDSRTMKRRNICEDMRYLLKEYNQAMYYYKDLMNCPEPSNRVVTSIRNWRANQGDPPIIDISEQAYDKTYEADLMALKPPKCDDPLSIFAQNYLGRFFKKPQPAHIPNSENVLYYSETAIDLFVTIICTLLAIIVLVGSMTTLFFVESQGVRLGLVWVFTFLFAISIFLMANLTKGEIFLATAA
ncbi:hypothetical protein H072_1222 [Dactylellina haptotyla CBS 200.50]|uniref:DUF6594 domain-containing protein n=1 Tax=Dactylellina haptotyla (strain CBS 200.50) TaxID=1284197 RepID=S8APJ7_DACHA|nr:hypothetical protein H072_1222 [Dactylellina haptotyla CBS 200.50]